MDLVVRRCKRNRLKLYDECASPLVITDTFLLLTLIPAAQCFLKFVGSYLMKSTSAICLENRPSSSRELVEIFRNTAIKSNQCQSHQDWEKLLGTTMLRSTSLQNFSVSHFNFFPLSPSPEPLEETGSSEKDLIDNHQQTISVMEDSLQLYENDVNYLESNIQALRHKSQESDELIHSLEQNVSRLNKMLERKESELTEVNRKMQNYHKYYCWSLVQIANLMKEENTLRDENISLLLLMEECCSDNEYYEGKLREYQEKLIQIEKEMSELTMNLEKRNDKFVEERNKSCNKISQLTTETESLKVQCEFNENELRKCRQMIDLYKNRLEQFKQLVDTKNTEISNLKQAVTLLETRLIEVQKEKASALRDLQSMRDKNEELTITKNNLTDKILILECSLHESKDETSNLAQTIKSLEEENEKLKLSHSIMEDEMNTTKLCYEQKLKEKDAQIEKSQKTSTKKELGLKKQLEVVREDLLLSKREMDATHTELQMVKTELKCKNELSRVMEDEHHKLNMSYEALYKEYSNTMDELNKSKKELDQLKETLSKTSEVNKHLEKIEETFKTRENKLEKDVQEKLRFFKYEVINKADKINQLEKLNLEYETQIKNLERDLQEKHDEVNEITEKMSVCERNLNSTRNSICPEKREYTQEILALIEINSAHCKRYHALEKAYRDLTVEYAAYKQMVGMSSTSSESADVNTVCNKHEGLIRKLKEENGYLNSTLADYKRINTLLLDQIKVSVSHSVLEDSLPPQSVTRYDTPEKDMSSTLSVDDRNTAELWWENEVSMHPSTLYESPSAHTLAYNPPCTETKSL